MAYETSALYKAAIDKESRETFIDGEIISKNGVIHVDNSMIVPGSLYVTNQCSNKDSFEYGAVFAAELGIVLKTEIDRYSLFDAKTTLWFNILVENRLGRKTYERIPLGEFYINESNRAGRNISIKAYDKMVELDKDIYESTTGTPYELLVYISTRCDVPLAQNREEISHFINFNSVLNVSPSRVSTYRELLSYICTITCSFAIIDRSGKLKLCKYSEVVTREVSSKTRVSSKFSDFETYFSHADASFIYVDNYKTYVKTNEGDGLTYSFGEIPVVQGLDETNQAIISNMFLELEKVRYTPSDVSFFGDPSIELGDLIKHIDRDGNEVLSLVTFYKWSYRGNHQVKSAGQNPRLMNLKDRTSRDVANLRAEVTAKESSTYTFTNSSQIEAEGETKQIASLGFAVSKGATCIAIATIPYEAIDDTTLTIRQLFDGNLMLGGDVQQLSQKGKHTITIMSYFETVSNSIHRYGLELGTDLNRIVIDPYMIKVALFGQGLLGEVKWDGTVNANEIIDIVEVGRKEISSSVIDEVVTTVLVTPVRRTVSDKVATVTINKKSVLFVGIDEEISTQEV